MLGIIAEIVDFVFQTNRTSTSCLILRIQQWYIGGSVLVPGRGSSIVEVTRFQFLRFTVSIKELAEWFGLEVARMVVDECLPRRRN